MDDSEEEEDMEEGDEDEDVLPLGIPYFPYPCVFLIPVRLSSEYFMYCPLRQSHKFPMMRVLLLLFLIELTCPDGGTRWYARARAQSLESLTWSDMQEIDPSNIVSRRTRGRKIDFAKEAEAAGDELEDDDEEDEEYVTPPYRAFLSLPASALVTQPPFTAPFK